MNRSTAAWCGVLAVVTGAIALAAVLSRNAVERRESLATRLESEQRFRSGLELARRFQLRRALHEFETCVRQDPTDAAARFQRGRILLALGQVAPARADFAAALLHAPSDPRIRRYLFDLHNFVEEFRDEAKAREHLAVLDRISRGLIRFDLQVHEAMYSHGLLDPYPMIAERLRGRRGDLDPSLAELYDAFFPGGNEDPGVQGIPGFAVFRRIFERCPGLSALRQSVALQLTNPSRLGLPEPQDDTIPGSTVPLGLAEQILEDLFDHSILLGAESLDLFSMLAILQMKMGDYAEAAARFRLVLERFANSDLVRQQSEFLLAVSEFKLENFERAADLFRKLAPSASYGQLAAWFLHLLDKNELPLRKADVPETIARGFSFREAAEELGVAKEDGGGGSAWGDHDGDGSLDLYVSGCDTFSALYRAEGGGFRDVSVDARLANINSGFSNLFVDYDNDGDLDLFVARDGWAGPMKNSLLENRDGKFFDVSERSGLLSGEPRSSFTSSWGDFDRDGDLDLFVANGVCGDGSTCRLWRNDGDGRFTDGTAAAGLDESPATRTIGCAVGDYDLDGWPDIFLSGIEPTPNRLYHNRGDGTFEEVARRAGVDDSALAALGFVAFIEDLDGDALPDILMTKWEEDFSRVLDAAMEGYRFDAGARRNTPRFFVNNGDGTFRDVSEAAGFVYPHGTMGAGLADLNNDGFLEVYLGNGGPSIERLEPDSLYVNLGGGRFEEAGRRFGLGHVGKGHGVSFADFDRDGDLDVYAPLGGAFHGDLWKNAFYINEAGNRLHWLQVALVGTESNRMAVGARVKVRAGGRTQQREKKCGVGFGSGDTPYLHFGLGDGTIVSELSVFWPSGATETFADVPADRFVRIVEGRGTFEIEDEQR